MPRTLTTQDRGNLIHTYQDGAQTALKLHGIRWHPDRYPQLAANSTWKS